MAHDEGLYLMWMIDDETLLESTVSSCSWYFGSSHLHMDSAVDARTWPADDLNMLLIFPRNVCLEARVIDLE